MLDGVKHVILILSGKGGVGKSTISTQLALALKDSGYKVGLLDVDLCGPSVPYLLQLEGRDVHQCPEGWVPIYADKDQRLAVMSIGFLLKDRNDGVVWRGPKKTAMIKQFLSDVYWRDIDYLVIDTPPGTSDEHITVMENVRDLNCDGAVVVTTPQEVAIDDVRKELTFCRKTGIPVLGILENLSGFVCPSCTECTNIFSSGGGRALATLAGVPFLGSLPVDSRLGRCGETGRSCLAEFPESPAAGLFRALVARLAAPC
ncbi:cytosolic Fe-S cluster assembly factor NUBP2 homolog [Bacillus rossius redtenbacheri]|uniref:cytosolic Fe-S cluster assembly factor NUBP2 homolog n=1 Tax=Bacillus rossius redtenbacheri TaxID=93214 RepID=UPI002FDE405E